MDPRLGGWLRTALIAALCIEYAIFAAVLLWALWTRLSGGRGDMQFHLLALQIVGGIAAAGLVAGLIVYLISLRMRDSREQAISWGALAALLGPAIAVAVATNVSMQTPRWVCFSIGGLASVALVLVTRALIGPRLTAGNK